MSSMRDYRQRTEKRGPDVGTGGPPRGGAFLGHTRRRNDIAAEVETNGDRDHTVGTRRRRQWQGLTPGRGPNTDIIAEVAVRAGNERKGLKKYAERAEVDLLIHLPSGDATQLWMHKKL